MTTDQIEPVDASPNREPVPNTPRATSTPNGPQITSQPPPQSMAIRIPRYEITARQSFLSSMSECLHSHELLLMFVKRDLAIRYSRANLGLLWLPLSHLLTIFVYTLFFGIIGRMGPDGFPYPVFLFPALIGWSYFNSAVSRSAHCVNMNVALIYKVYFPRALLPIASVVSPIVSLVAGAVVMILFLLIMGYAPGIESILVIPYLALAIAAALGAGMFFAAMNTYFRDIGHALPAIMQLWFFSTPVLYPSNLVAERLGEQWIPLYFLNPMATVAEGVRASILGTPHPDPALITISVLSACAMLTIGMISFHKLQRSIAEIL